MNNISFMNNFIMKFENSLPSMLCEEIIIKFELSEYLKYTGLTIGGVHTHIKDTTDLLIEKNNSKWDNIEKILSNELHIAIKKYVNSNKTNNYEYNNSYFRYNLFDTSSFHTEHYMIQKYEKGKGKYIYHHDFLLDMEKKKYRVITFIWYLNDIEHGGETEFFGGDIKIKPKKGMLLLFPSSWTFPHRGIMPISDNKYIITGWMYIDSHH